LRQNRREFKVVEIDSMATKPPQTGDKTAAALQLDMDGATTSCPETKTPTAWVGVL